MGNSSISLGCGKEEPIFSNSSKLEVVRGPDACGCYYILDKGGSSKVSIRYRFRANAWEWRTKKSEWSLIPQDSSQMRLMKSSIDALACLRDSNPIIPFERHIKVKSFLGKGAFGTVYKVKFNRIMGHDRFLPVNTDLAMKTINKDRGTYTPEVWMELALENEITMLKQLNHPCILRFYQCISYRGETAMVTELCTGGTADDLRKKTKGILAEDTILTMISHCVQALHVLHAKHIVHRDIKPDNIFVTYDAQGGIVFKLGDFGLAKVMMHSNDLLSHPGAQHFHAPEVIKAGFSSLPAMSTKSDIWALGLSVYFMCTSTYPFSNLNKHAEFRTRAPFNRINNVLGAKTYRSEIQSFLDASLKKDWQDRASAGELIAEFKHIILSQHIPGNYFSPVISVP